MNKSTKLAACLVVLLSGTVSASQSFAATATTTVAVSATVIDSCTVNAAPMSFGNYNVITGGTLDIVGTVTPHCTTGTLYAISLDAGVGSGATMQVRQLTGPVGATLMYSIYTDVNHTTVWGDGTGGTVMQSGTGNGATQPITMYGRIPAEQNPTVGTYSDTVTVTLTY